MFSWRKKTQKTFNENWHGTALFSFCASHGMPVMSGLPLCFLTVQRTQAGADCLGVRDLY